MSLVAVVVNAILPKMIVMNAKKFHFASHDHSKYDYLEGIIISVLPTRNPIKEYLRNN